MHVVLQNVEQVRHVLRQSPMACPCACRLQSKFVDEGSGANRARQGSAQAVQDAKDHVPREARKSRAALKRGRCTLMAATHSVA